MAANAADVREFARTNGLKVGARGQFSREVIAAYNKGKRADKRYVKPAERTA